MTQGSVLGNLNRLFVAGCMIATFGAGRVGAQQKIETEVVTLRDGGFYPSKITRPAGTFLLVVLNRSHANSVSPGITGPGASVVVGVASMLDLKQSFLLTLSANSYTLTDSAHAAWTPLTIVLH
jgi:hypothetical protein